MKICANIGYFYRYGFLTHFMFSFYSSIDHGRITVFNNFVFLVKEVMF
jgi:hypothetical protein